jgi:hypothetical protein
LPATAVHSRNASAIVAEQSSISQWLEEIKTGWSARFAPAFEKLGFKNKEDLANMSREQLPALETELQKGGARLVHMKQFRKALKATSANEKENDSLAQACADSSCQSPMAAYFGENENKAGHMPRRVVAKAKRNSSLNLPTVLPALLECKQGSRLRSPQDNDMSGKICKEFGLPCKSPMSAYFDGDHIGSFHIDDDACRDAIKPLEGQTVPLVPHCILSFPIVTAEFPFNFFQEGDLRRRHIAPCLTDSTLSPAKATRSTLVTKDTSISAKSALHKSKHRKHQRISWAEEAEEKTGKAPLRLLELLDGPGSKSSANGRAIGVWQTSQDPKGTFEVQKALEECSNETELWALVSELHGHVLQATQCPHANHVLRKAISLMPAQSLDFMVAELMHHGPAVVIEIARHRYGCRIVEGLLSKCPLEQVQGLVDCLFPDAAALCTHMYGNFVMQRLFEQPISRVRLSLLQIVHSNLPAFGTNFYGSAVVGKAMQSASHEEKLLLVQQIIRTNGLLAAIARYRHGKSVVDIVLAALEGDRKDTALAQLAAPPLKVPKVARTY